MSDLKNTIADAEELLAQAANATGDKAQELRESALKKLKMAKDKILDLQDVVVDKSKAAARATDDYVHDNPWKAIGIAAGVGVVLGLLLNRK
ncbi:DUF883 family protein [Ampullimonas aquatilis]|uniref:DUF883 family protein n=1 Tax=Ampullimonas aquatilis TaxID=1341549 RepID=UPI003C794B08